MRKFFFERMSRFPLRRLAALMLGAGILVGTGADAAFAAEAKDRAAAKPSKTAAAENP